MSDTAKPATTVYVAAFGALLGSVSMGLALGYTTPAFDDMDRNPSASVLSDDQETRDGQKALIGSMLALGALVGGFLNEPSNKILGRKLSLLAYGVPFIIGWMFIWLANGVPMLVFGRLLTGLCCGLVSGTAPTYVVEIAPPSIRGLLGTSFQVMAVIGILLACFWAFLHLVVASRLVTGAVAGNDGHHVLHARDAPVAPKQGSSPGGRSLAQGSEDYSSSAGTRRDDPGGHQCSTRRQSVFA
jgi:MFS family permease